MKELSLDIQRALLRECSVEFWIEGVNSFEDIFNEIQRKYLIFSYQDLRIILRKCDKEFT